MPVPNAKSLGVLLWGPGEAAIQKGAVAGPRGWSRRCWERCFPGWEGSLGRRRADGPDSSCLGGAVCTAFPELGPSAPLLFPKEGTSQPAVA